MLKKLNDLVKDNPIVLQTGVKQNEQSIVLQAHVLIEEGKYLEHYFSFEESEMSVDDALSLFVASIDNFKEIGYYDERDFEHFKSIVKAV